MKLAYYQVVFISFGIIGTKSVARDSGQYRGISEHRIGKPLEKT
jgi:hypothetical protein